jgi:ferredoxin
VPHVAFLPSGRTVEVPAGSTILEAALAAGLPIARACGADGLCGRCGVRVLAGEIDAESDGEAATRRRNRLDPALRLACRARVLGDVEVTASYW